MSQGADRLVDEVERDLTRKLQKAGFLYVSAARLGLNRAQPYRRTRGGKSYRGLSPSRPGQYPKKLTGQLQRAIAFQVERTPRGPVLYLGVSLAGYPAFLQLGTPAMLPRPWLTLTWTKIQGVVTRLLTGGMT